MFLFKIILSTLIIFCSTNIGIIISKRYIYRLQELDEIRNCFLLMETKIRYTYEPIADIFNQIAEISSDEIRKLFQNIIKNINDTDAKIGWERGIAVTDISITKEDKEILKKFGKMLGQTDKEGQISEINQIVTLLDRQIKQAELAREKNEKMYKKMGLITGIGLVIVLI